MQMLCVILLIVRIQIELDKGGVSNREYAPPEFQYLFILIYRYNLYYGIPYFEMRK